MKDSRRMGNSLKIKGYCGNAKPYIYAVFHESDSNKAHEVLEHLISEKYSVWCEDAFNGKAKKRMDKASAVMLFMTPAASADDRMNEHINYAVTKSIPIVTVYLEPTELTPSQKLQLNTYQGLMKYSFESDALFYEKLYKSPVMLMTSVTPAQKKAARRTSTASWLIAAASVLLIVFILFLSSVGGTVKEGSLMDNFGYTGALSDISDIYIYATKTMDENHGASSPLKENGNDYIQIAKTGEKLIMGDIEDVSDFSQLKKLKNLVFAGNALTDVSPLFRLKSLEYLDISCNPVKNLDGIENAKSLKTLSIAYTDIEDMALLLRCDSLETVYVSCDQTELFEGINAGFLVVPAEHIWSDWVTRTEATFTKGGERYRRCSVCGEEEKAVIPQIDLYNLGIENLTPHIFGGKEEWGESAVENLYGIFIAGVSTEYTYVFRKNGTVIDWSGREYLDDDGDGLPNKTHIMPDREQMGVYDPGATYTLEASDGENSCIYTIKHKFDD